MKWFVLLFVLAFLLISGGLLLNRPPLLSPPGPLERIKTYLTTNVAETRLDHEFPELRTPLFAARKEQTQEFVLTAMRSIGWREVQAISAEVRAVVVSPLLRFRDDVTVRLGAKEGGTLVQARSASRIGKWNLAANTQHLQVLFSEVENLVSTP